MNTVPKEFFLVTIAGPTAVGKSLTAECAITAITDKLLPEQWSFDETGITVYQGIIIFDGGQFYRHQIASDTPFGQRVKTILAEGGLIPDAQHNGQVTQEIAQRLTGLSRGIILIGTPRTDTQAVVLTSYFYSMIQQATGLVPKFVSVCVEAPKKVCQQRFEARQRETGGKLETFLANTDTYWKKGGIADSIRFYEKIVVSFSGHTFQFDASLGYHEVQEQQYKAFSTFFGSFS